MRICIVGKYPPIEGGVSSSTYWLAYGLAERGHQVSVVTNADEVEDEYRIRLAPDDRPLYAPVFPSGGSVEVFSTERLSWRMSHIPQHNPFATKLAGLATQVIRSRGCEVIVTYYFEPYAIASCLAASWTGVPWVARNAGSDIDRLARIPELGTAYKEALRSASALVVAPRLVRRYSGMGMPLERLFTTEPQSPPPSFFHPRAAPLEVDRVEPVVAPTDGDGAPLPFDPALPTIGIYGKIGVSKGSFDLLQALSMLRREGLRFNLLALTQGRGFPPFADAIRELGLADCARVLPFLPNWRVPSFIRACTAVCFLERDFSIKIHTPMVAYEVLATGTCLVLSGEIAAKQASRASMVDGENVLLVSDPKDHHELAAKLRLVIEDPAQARRIGAAGTELAKDPGAFGRSIESWEEVLLRVSGRDSTARSHAELAADLRAAAEADGTEPLSRTMPWLSAIVPERAPELFAGFRSAAPPAATGDAVREGLDFCDFLRERLSANGLGPDRGLLMACLEFQTHRLRAAAEDEESRSRPPFPGADRLAGAPVTASRARALHPTRSRYAELVELAYDVTPLFAGDRGAAGDDQNAGASGGGRPAIAAEPTIVCFLRPPNLQRTELKLSPAIRELYELCDGSRSTAAILDTLAERHGVEPAERPGHDERYLGTLQKLYDHRVLAFCSGD